MTTPLPITARELMALRFTDPKWAVPGILPEGLFLIAARPKMGMKWREGRYRRYPLLGVTLMRRTRPPTVIRRVLTEFAADVPPGDVLRRDVRLDVCLKLQRRRDLTADGAQYPAYGANRGAPPWHQPVDHRLRGTHGQAPKRCLTPSRRPRKGG